MRMQVQGLGGLHGARVPSLLRKGFMWQSRLQLPLMVSCLGGIPTVILLWAYTCIQGTR